MGKTKLFTEPETSSNSSNPTFRNTARRKSVVQIDPHGLPVDQLPLGVLLQQIRLRLRRWWIALRFRMDQVTMGLFGKQTVLKLATLAVLAYALTGTEILSGGSDFESTEEESKSILAEQHLEGADLGQPSRNSRAAKQGKRPSEKRNESKTPKSSAAPVGVRHLVNVDDQTRDYIERFSKIARIEMEKYGVPASISLAQGLIESRAGTSKLARNNNNHFGIKCFQRNCRKGHCTNHTDDSHKDFFRNFPNAWESWRAHSVMISTGRYAKLKKYGRNYQRWAYGLKSVGYATDRNYDKKLIGVIERYQLYRYDR